MTTASCTSRRTCRTRCRRLPRWPSSKLVREQELPARAERAGERLRRHRGELAARHEPVGGRNALAAFQGLGLTHTPNGIRLDRLTHTQRRILELLEIKPPWPEQDR